MRQQTTFFCTQCQQMKLFQRPAMSHTPHILASVFLCGLWLPVWAIIALAHSPAWRCSFCGFGGSANSLAVPPAFGQIPEPRKPTRSVTFDDET